MAAASVRIPGTPDIVAIKKRGSIPLFQCTGTPRRRRLKREFGGPVPVISGVDCKLPGCRNSPNT